MEQVMDTANSKANIDFLFISFFLFYFLYFRTNVCKKSNCIFCSYRFPINTWFICTRYICNFDSV